LTHTKRMLFVLSHPDAAPVKCRVVVSPDYLNHRSVDAVAGMVVRKAIKFFDIGDTTEGIEIDSAREMSDQEDDIGNC
jgi:hypothetical protein